MRPALSIRLAAAAALSLVPAILPAQAPASAQAPLSADDRLRQLYTAAWAWQMAEFGDLPGPGPGTLAGYLPRVDPAAQQARLAYWERVLAELGSIPVAELSQEERVNASVFRALIEEQANDVRFRTYEAPFNSDSFFWTDLAPRSGFADAAEYERYIERLRDLPRYFDENIANMRAGLARGFSIPRVT